MMAHIGFTPERARPGRVPGAGRGNDAERWWTTHGRCRRRRLRGGAGDGAAALAAEITKALDIPTSGIGAGAIATRRCWSGRTWRLDAGTPRRFVKRYADLRGNLLTAARAYADDVRGGVFPGPEHSFES